MHRQRARREYFVSKRIKSLKTDLQKALGVVCHEQKWINGANNTNVFLGFRLRKKEDCRDDPLGC